MTTEANLKQKLYTNTKMTQINKNNSALTNQLVNSVKLTAMGWEASKLSKSFTAFVLTEGIYKEQFETRLKQIIKDVSENASDDIQWDYREWEELTIEWWLDEGERKYDLVFEGYVFKSFVGTQTISLDDVIEGAGRALIVQASDYLQEKENWLREVYNFVVSNLKYAEVE